MNRDELLWLIASLVKIEWIELFFKQFSDFFSSFFSNYILQFIGLD